MANFNSDCLKSQRAKQRPAAPITHCISQREHTVLRIKAEGAAAKALSTCGSHFLLIRFFSIVLLVLVLTTWPGRGFPRCPHLAQYPVPRHPQLRTPLFMSQESDCYGGSICIKSSRGQCHKHRAGIQVTEFLMLCFPGMQDTQHWLSIVLAPLLVLALGANFVLLLAIWQEVSLHEPMYYLLAILSMLDVILCLTVIPKGWVLALVLMDDVVEDIEQDRHLRGDLLRGHMREDEDKQDSAEEEDEDEVGTTRAQGLGHSSLCLESQHSSQDEGVGEEDEDEGGSQQSPASSKLEEAVEDDLVEDIEQDRHLRGDLLLGHMCEDEDEQDGAEEEDEDEVGTTRAQGLGHSSLCLESQHSSQDEGVGEEDEDEVGSQQSPASSKLEEAGPEKVGQGSNMATYPRQRIISRTEDEQQHSSYKIYS
ncbi:hypothetical protein MC885_016555 [Smutsia gigantea]|nr:hypothetical protein MC885_016555 [Smutsia gigantea]